jgi:hypothetical protein
VLHAGVKFSLNYGENQCWFIGKSAARSWHARNRAYNRLSKIQLR